MPEQAVFIVCRHRHTSLPQAHNLPGYLFFLFFLFHPPSPGACNLEHNPSLPRFIYIFFLTFPTFSLYTYYKFGSLLTNSFFFFGVFPPFSCCLHLFLQGNTDTTSCQSPSTIHHQIQIPSHDTRT